MKFATEDIVIYGKKNFCIFKKGKYEFHLCKNFMYRSINGSPYYHITLDETGSNGQYYMVKDGEKNYYSDNVWVNEDSNIEHSDVKLIDSKQIKNEFIRLNDTEMLNRDQIILLEKSIEEAKIIKKENIKKEFWLNRKMLIQFNFYFQDHQIYRFILFSLNDKYQVLRDYSDKLDEILRSGEVYWGKYDANSIIEAFSYLYIEFKKYSKEKYIYWDLEFFTTNEYILTLSNLFFKIGTLQKDNKYNFILN